MKASAAPLKPTDSELTILQVLWRKGPSTSREVHAEIDGKNTISTTQKFLRILTEKGLVEAEEQPYAWRYKARYSENEVQQYLTSAFVDKVFGGSAVNLISQALATSKTSSEDVAAIRRIVAQHKKT